MKDVAAGVARYEPVARHSISYYTMMFPGLDPDEIESAVMYALYRCVVRYEPSRGSFRALFQPRAYGAVRDAARDIDPLTRTDRGLLNRGELRPDGSTVVRPRSRSLDADRPLWDQDEGTNLEYHDVVGVNDPNLDDLLEGGHEEVDVEELLGSLPERERLSLYLVYFEEMTQARAGEVMGVTASRISQLNTRGLERIRALIEGQRSAQHARLAA